MAISETKFRVCTQIMGQKGQEGGELVARGVRHVVWLPRIAPVNSAKAFAYHPFMRVYKAILQICEQSLFISEHAFEHRCSPSIFLPLCFILYTSHGALARAHLIIIHAMCYYRNSFILQKTNFIFSYRSNYTVSIYTQHFTAIT